MKTKIITLALTLIFGCISVYGQEKSKSGKDQSSPAKMEMKCGASQPSCCMQKGDSAKAKCDMKPGNEKMNTTGAKNKTEATRTYTCPMHPEVTSDKPGKCPKCGMSLALKK
jgi:hypothetical protein